ncbi:REJ domain-containing protein, variant 2 [Balamuthia mandrillaris]
MGFNEAETSSHWSSGAASEGEPNQSALDHLAPPSSSTSPSPPASPSHPRSSTFSNLVHRDLNRIKTRKRSMSAWEEAERLERKRTEPVRACPDTWQLQFWHKYLGWLFFSDKWYSKWIGFLFVAPLTELTGLSLHYQLYLFEIFHTSFICRLCHFICIPLINFFLFCFCGSLWTDIGEEREVNYVMWSASVFVALYLAGYYIVWGFLQRDYMFGIFTAPVVLAFWMHSNIYISKFRHMDGEEHAWYDPTPLPYNPLLWLAICGYALSISHGMEPLLPPRVNYTPHWTSMAQWLKSKGLIRGYGTLFMMSFMGTIDELMASPRLFPILFLKVMYLLGYRPDQWKDMRKIVKWSSKYGNPSLDFMGRGGTMRQSPESIDEVKVRCKLLKRELSSPDLTKSPGLGLSLPSSPMPPRHSSSRTSSTKDSGSSSDASSTSSSSSSSPSSSASSSNAASPSKSSRPKAPSLREIAEKRKKEAEARQEELDALQHLLARNKLTKYTYGAFVDDFNG